MERNRRQFLTSGVTLAAVTASAFSETLSRTHLAPDKGAQTGRCSVLYNGDEDYFYFSGPERMDRAYLEGIVNRLADAKVTIFSNTFYAAGRCFYNTRMGLRFDQDPFYEYSPTTGRYGDVRYWRVAENFRRLANEGNDPIEVFVTACHQRGLKFLACLRMNDRHRIYVEHPPQLLHRHPEMVLKGENGKPIGGMDFQYPEVRDHIFNVMDELATAYDIDGLELDWMRWCQMFSADVPREKRVAIMTEYHLRVRTMLDNAGRRKGKVLLLSIRVPTTLGECQSLGFDVPTYVREGLVDFVCPSDFLFVDPHLPVVDYARIVRGSKVKLLPSLHASPGRSAGPATTENLRAIAHSYYAQGADGISLYNYYTSRERNFPENYQAIEEAGDPTVLAAGPREYLFNPIWGGRTSQTGRKIDYRAEVSRSETGKRAVFPLFIKEDMKKIRASLKWKIENLTRDDDIRIDVNGEALEPAKFTMLYSSWGKLEDMRYFDEGWCAGSYYLFEVKDATQYLRDGANEIGLTLLRGNLKLDTSIALFEVRLEVRVI